MCHYVAADGFSNTVQGRLAEERGSNLPTINVHVLLVPQRASGSKLAARRDGIQQARNATAAKNIGTTVKVTKSCG
jgi:hypothetical protein